MRKPRSAYNYLGRAADARRGQKLGMTFPTAQSRLWKAILFSLIPNKDCFRCGQLITLEVLSIDHKEAWQKSVDPKASFFDLDNIAFSHRSCNAREGGKMCGGEIHYKTSLTEEDVRVIRRKKTNGSFLRELADEYSMSVGGIHAIVTRRSWKNVQ